MSILAAVPSWIWAPATSTTGSYTVGWGASMTSGATYYVEEATDGSFTAPVKVYEGTVTTVTVNGRGTGTYYYRVKAQAAGYAGSGWKSTTAGCEVSIPAVVPSWIWAPAASTTGSYTVGWGASTTPGATYYVEEATDGSFTAPVKVYEGTATTVTVNGRGAGTYYYRVKTQAVGYADSGWKVTTPGCVVSIQTAMPSWAWSPATSATGSYTIGWGTSTTPGATYYVEEATTLDFAMPIVVYTGAGTTVGLSGRPVGTYYYRVKSQAGGYSDSAWRNSPNSTVVTH